LAESFHADKKEGRKNYILNHIDHFAMFIH